MFVGHGLLAFALVAFAAHRFGWDAERALQVGAVAALFATLPDVDILYGPVGLLGGVSGAFDAAEAFWSAGNVIHRGPTHSLVFGTVVALSAGLWHRETTPSRLLAAAVGALLVGTAALASGGLAAVVTAIMLLGGAVLCVLAGRWGLSAKSIITAALVGLLSHPFGDLFTGEPPAMLYPFDVTLVVERLVLHTDPTLHLLSAFAVELGTIWLALAVYAHVRQHSLRSHVDRRAGLGMAYAAAALALPAPTLETSYHFVGSVLALAVVGVSSRSWRSLPRVRVVATGLAAVTLAAATYAITYVLL